MLVNIIKVFAEKAIKCPCMEKLKRQEFVLIKCFPAKHDSRSDEINYKQSHLKLPNHGQV